MRMAAGIARYWLLLPTIGCFALWLLYLAVAWQRMDYPYQIEWIEGGILQQVVQVARGLPLYASPDSDYAPALYMPLYYYLSALAGSFSGDYFFGMRLVSFVASLLTAVACGVSVGLLVRHWCGAVLGFLAYFLPYRFTGYWYDVGRVDSLWTMWLALTLMSLVLAFYCKRQHWLWLAVLSFAGAFLTKQSSLFLSPFLFVAVWAWFGLRAAVQLATVAAALLLSLVLLLTAWLGDLFFYATFEMATAHAFNWRRIDMFLLLNLLLSIPALLLFSLAFIAGFRQQRQEGVGWLFLLLGFSAISAISRMYSGGAENVMMPCYMLIVITGCAGFWHFCAAAQRKWWSSGLAVLLFLLNIYWAWFDVQQQVPTTADRAAGDALVARIRQVPGRVCLTKDGYLAYLAGKDFCAHNAFLADIHNGKDRQLADRLAAGMNERILSGYYRVIVLNNTVEVTGYGLELEQLPYTAELIDYHDGADPSGHFFPVAGGPRPGSWLEFNGTGWRDNR